MIHIAVNINTTTTFATTTMAELARQLEISAKQLTKYANSQKLFKKHWVIASIEPLKCLKKGRFK